MGKSSKSRIGKIIAVIPDVQAKPGVSNTHLEWVGNYLAEKRPDAIICLGDFGDLPSLNSHGKLLELEGQRYRADVEATQTAMEKLLTPINSVKGYKPLKIMTLGNHEERADRLAKEIPTLQGVISSQDLGYKEAGWRVVPFLRPVRVYGIEFCHYFVSGAMGRPVSSAAALLRERQCSAIQGHTQFTDLCFHKKTGNFALFAGICYLHSEEYLGFQGNTTRRQIVMLNEVKQGTADPMFASLAFLKSRYS